VHPKYNLAFRITVHVACIAPMALLLWDVWRGNLSANPLQNVTYRTGDWALRLLIASLACTPLNSLFHFRAALLVRRALGLYAFGYALAHFLIFIGVDYRFDFGLIWIDLADKRYILIGFAALLLLTPLAITSTKSWMKRLGKRWKSLHKLVYVIAPLAVIHYVWLVKADIRTPLIYGAIVLILLAVRATKLLRLQMVAKR